MFEYTASHKETGPLGKSTRWGSLPARMRLELGIILRETRLPVAGRTVSLYAGVHETGDRVGFRAPFRGTGSPPFGPARFGRMRYYPWPSCIHRGRAS